MVLRSLLLYLSQQKQLRRWMETPPAADRLQQRGQKVDRAAHIARIVAGSLILLMFGLLALELAPLYFRNLALQRYTVVLHFHPSAGRL